LGALDREGPASDGYERRASTGAVVDRGDG
jgi:hypothetical protein